MTPVAVLLAAAGVFSISLVFVLILRRPIVGLYLTIFATAILTTPELPAVREKVALPELMIVLTWLAMLGRTQGAATGGVPVIAPQRAAVTIGGAFAAVVLISFVVNVVSFPEGFVPSAVETANFVYGFLLFVTVVRMVDDWEKWRGCIVAWVCGAALASAVGVWALIGGAPGWTYDEFTGRISSTLKFENQVPSLLLPIYPAVVLLTVTRSVAPRFRILLALLVVAMTATVFGSGSRTALAMLAICIAGAFYIAAREARFRALSMGLLVLLGAALLTGLALFVAYVLVSQEADYRLGVTPAWQRGVLMLGEWFQGERPLDETRPDQIRLVLERVPDFILFGTGPKLSQLRLQAAEVHNTFAGVLIEAGVIGFCLFMIWTVYVGVMGWQAAAACRQADHRLLALALVVGFVALQVYGMFIFGLRQRNIWLLAGLVMAIPRLNVLTDLKRADAGPDRSADVEAPRKRGPRLARAGPDRVRRKLSPGRVRPAADTSLAP